MIWVLFIVFSQSNGVHTNTVAFQTENLCKKAAAKVKTLPSMGEKVKVTCLKVKN